MCRLGRIVVGVCVAAWGLAPRAGVASHYVVVLLDDVGVDKFAAYGEAADPPPTPTLDALAARGVLFRNAWATPACSPTRAAVLTGRRGELTGIGTGIPRASLRSGEGLATDERTLADVLRSEGYATAAIGKWHLGHDAVHPLEVGFDTHRGSNSNVGKGGYYRWRKSIDGVDQGWQTSYATTDTADEAVRWIEAQTGPWFLWLSFNAPHLPLHSPPPRLHTRGELSGARPPLIYAAMLEAMDAELGRVVAAAGPDTTFFVMGDNGTYGVAIEPPFDSSRGKRSIYEGGVRVPLIVAGADVPVANRGTESAALVQASDLFATVSELAGSRATAEDAVSFVPQLLSPSSAGRSVLYTSRFLPNGGPPQADEYARAARDARFKLIRRQGDSRQELYDLGSDPFETTNLLEEPLEPRAQAALRLLSGVIDAKQWPRSPAASRGDFGWALLVCGAFLLVGLLIARRVRGASSSS